MLQNFYSDLFILGYKWLWSFQSCYKLFYYQVYFILCSRNYWWQNTTTVSLFCSPFKLLTSKPKCFTFTWLLVITESLLGRNFICCWYFLIKYPSDKQLQQIPVVIGSHKTSGPSNTVGLSVNDFWTYIIYMKIIDISLTSSSVCPCPVNGVWPAKTTPESTLFFTLYNAIYILTEWTLNGPP